MEKTPAELEAEKQALANTEEADLVNQNGQVKTSAEIAAELQEKYKDLPAEEMLGKIAEDLAKKNEIISHKNRAIEALKKPKAETPPAKNDDIDAKIQALVDQKIGEMRNSFSTEDRIKNMSSNPEEQAKIRDAYNNSIVKSGDIEADLKKALAIANASIIEEFRSNRSEAEANQLILAKFSAGQSSGGHSDDPLGNDPVKRAAYNNLLAVGISPENALKAVNKK